MNGSACFILYSTICVLITTNTDLFIDTSLFVFKESVKFYKLYVSNRLHLGTNVIFSNALLSSLCTLLLFNF